ncbi:FMN-dependent NADH-azoreductase [Acetobacter cibinongensis]|uniref:FMN dependent NADH:quinone oxidoreductase n=1 Tax=Acetobacter cibinongensis TaxID=146475 RepID=A0A0D6N0F5_9PROT|nr:NAD(P)H-dependent oxidoreductase [Acetobacter cibinongensis]GAN59404.1 acyl carrier protein phosphodiesterase [Acetobacter cibinongensis]GBQ15561.1 ACP phosphodiesterase [Acetobacter cibinongensis NRIC 0482]GEL59748.1 FMN-dependent NADH-azoreductase [Acetobacter cibinongensis]
MTLLHIDSSILGTQSTSRSLTAATVKHLTSAAPEQAVTYRDLAESPLGDLSGAEFLAFQGMEAQDDSAKQKVARNTKILEEFLAARTVVVGAPMYNFSLPSQLKSWLDRLAVAGKTFRYSTNGVEGLAGGKRVIVVSSRGGIYSEGAAAAPLDHQETFLRGFFGFIGITDVTFIRAEGLALGEDSRNAALEAAQAEIAKLLV